jgi:hypothetical protein
MLSQLMRLTPNRVFDGVRRRAFSKLRETFLGRPVRSKRRYPMVLLIVGAPRTGSSFIVRALTHAAGFAGMSEGHVTPLIAAVDRIVVQYYAYMQTKGLLSIRENTIANIPQDRLRRELLRTFERFDRGLFPFARRVLDKTVNAEAIAALPLLLNAWPGARILYLKRDGVENVISAENYFKVSLDEACANWTNCAAEWDLVKPLLPEDSYLELDHLQVTDSPGTVTARLATHLNLSGRARRRLLNYLDRDTQEWLALRKRRPPLAELNWSPERLRRFLSICGEQMIKQGYATRGEVEEILASTQPSAVDVLPFCSAILPADSRREQDPGQSSLTLRLRPGQTTLVMFDRLDVRAKAGLFGSVTAELPLAGQSVRMTVILTDSSNGEVFLTHALMLEREQPAALQLLIPCLIETMDAMFQIRMSERSSTVQDCAVEIQNLRLESS